MRLALPGRTIACRAIIFDKDGTLIDLATMQLALGCARSQAIQAMAGDRAALAWQKAVGFDLAASHIDRDGPLCLAPRREELLVAAGAFYQLGYPWDQARSLAQQAYDRADELLEPPYGSRLLDGVDRLLADLHAMGLLLGIATTDRRWRTEAALSALGVFRFFSAIVGAEDVEKVKPAPDMALLACDRLGCRPEEAVVVGDSPVDLEMGRAAGVAACLGVPTGLNEAARLAPLADAVLPSAAALKDCLLPD